MANNKIYNLLPAHLQNKELETIFDTTLERAFSQGDVEKTRAFVGRKEKGVFKDTDAYLSFPEHLYQRDNYGLEPVFSNTVIGDNIYYDDLLNSLFNKGALTNDHRRLFSADTSTINLPIDLDKFINWELYYWINPGFTVEVALYSYFENADNEMYWKKEKPFILTGEPGTGNIAALLNGKAAPNANYATTGDYAVVMSNNEVVYWLKSTSGWARLGTTDTGAPTFTYDSARPASPAVGDTFVDTTKLRFTLKINDKTYILKDTIEDRWNIETNPYALRFVTPGEGILNLIEYRATVNDSTPDWETYIYYTNIFILGNTTDIHYITLDKDVDYTTDINWWSDRNSWYHYDDIRQYINSDSNAYVEQAKRPIIEFDKRLELSTASQAAVTFAVPTFKVYDSSNTYIADYKIFHYVEDVDSVMDAFMGINAKLTAGDYASEYTFNIDIPDSAKFKINSTYEPLYIPTTFDYRNLRHEYGTKTHTTLELLQAPKSSTTIDVYVDGIKQIGNYTYSNLIITFASPVTGYVYVDFTTLDNVIVDGDGSWQRIDPSLEYNPDNLNHNNREMTYSTVYEHMLRIVETTTGLTGYPNAVNNYRNLGDNTNKLRNNSSGSVMVKNSIDIKKAYFSITRDDYNPFSAIEYVSNSYNNYKNKLVTITQQILADHGSESKNDNVILEQAINEIALAKRENISVFSGSNMVNAGDTPSHYITSNVSPVVANSKIQFIPTSISTEIIDNENVSVYVNGVLEIGYSILNGIEISFENNISASDEIEVRYYKSLSESFIPPSATKLGISSLYRPTLSVDTEFDTNTTFLFGHDGSKMPIWGDRTDDIMFLFEKLIYNRIAKTTANASMKNIKYGLYRDSTTEYSFNEKKYTMYPFFKKWMLRNNIDNLYNTDFDANDYKTWNYRAKNDVAPGYWRGIFQYAYGTDNPLVEPWMTVGFSRIPDGFETDVLAYTRLDFWTDLKTTYSATWPIPIDANGNLRNINDLFFGSQITSAEISLMNQDWEFGDGSPIEQAWRRSSEYPFIEFLLSMLTKPFEVIDTYSTELNSIIAIYHKAEGVKLDTILAEQEGYTFKLGSKLGGFVNNFKLSSENSALSNSRYTDIPTDNYDLFIHTGEPNRSEGFSALVLEKVSIDDSYPTYSLANISTYVQGTTVYNTSDKKYYRRKSLTVTSKESSAIINFDYAAWTLIAQPNITKFGYRIQGYDDYNPTFFTMDWDKTSATKTWSTRGDEMTLNNWVAGSFYRMDEYTIVNGVPYVSLADHTGSANFNDDITDYWKILATRPRINQISAHGYKETLPDQIKTHNYGDVLYSLDDAAQLLIGYQNYLQAVGWSFTDSNELGENVDFENLLLKFLDWSAEKHEVGEFITLTPMLLSGRFSAPYGVATVKRETSKNFYRVVDSAGRQIPNSAITFYTDGDAIIWESTIPIYGMKIDITDVEHAYVIDRVDNYGDIIYDPINHNRNLRMIIDCNRTANWNGTLAADGYIVHDNKLIPNFETMVADTKHHRDTLVDQSLSTVNLLKASHYGYTPRTYLLNHFVERESQLEFYKGFLAAKGTKSSINRIVNNNSNFSDVKSEDMWAFKLGEYGNLNRNLSASINVDTTTIFSDPHAVVYPSSPFIYKTTKRTTPIKTTGYVDSRDVNYIVRNSTILETSVSDSYYEGDLAWIQFDAIRDWDVRRLSEISEIVYVGETEDSQLYITLSNVIDITDAVYVKIKNDDIDPELNGYYYLIDDGTVVSAGTTAYKYLVFDTDFEPVIVEIDSATVNSIYVPTSDNSGVEAIGTKSNPVFINSEVLIIDGGSFTYQEGVGNTATGVIIGGNSATPDPIVSSSDQIRITVYDDTNLIKNTNTIVNFTGTGLTAPNLATSLTGDSIVINGNTNTPLIIENSSTQSISAVSSITTSSDLESSSELTVTVDNVTTAYTASDIIITGTIAAPVISETKAMNINGTTVTFDASLGTLTLTEIISQINSTITSAAASDVGGVLVLSSSLAKIELSGSVIVELGLHTSSQYIESKLKNLSAAINTKTDVTSYINASDNLVINSTGASMTLAGDEFNDFGFPGTEYNSTTAPTALSVAAQINNLGINGVSASVVNNKLRVAGNTTDLTLTESTVGSMTRLGFVNATETINSLTSIISDINAILSLDTNMVASAIDRRLLISGNEYKVSISNLSGNPLTDLGITSGDYISTNSISTSLLEFRDQINNTSSVITASITSDGRFVLTSSGLSMSFSGTSELLLDRIGLYKDYTSITSNANFKIMRWKSVRFTPGYNGENFDVFYQDLGLNSSSKIWADEYGTGDWAVLNRTTIGNLEIANRKAKEIDVDLVNRVIIKDGEDFTIHNLYDPLNLKLPGEVLKDIDYVNWNDPAKYDEYLSSGLWLEERLGEIWWDTTNTRFYRYNDYGDANGNILVEYVKRNWGKLVNGSQISIKQWVKNTVLPTGITWFNQEKEWDPIKNKEVTTYYYWTSVGTLPRYEKEYSTDEIKMIIETGDVKNKFIPINANTIVISNKQKFMNRYIDIKTEYSANTSKQYKHADWELLSRESNTAVMAEYLTDMKNSIANSKVKNYKQLTTSYYDLDDQGAFYTISFLTDLAVTDLAISVNNEFLELDDFSISGTTLRINNNFDVIMSDVVRVYEMTAPETNWFSNITDARDNFKSIVNDHFDTRLLDAYYPFNKDYIKLNHYIFNSKDWFIDEDYKTVTDFEFLSRTRNIDMKTMFDAGTRSFKVKNDDVEEYYYGYGDPKVVTLVNKVNGAMNIDFSNIVLPGQSGNSTGVSQYYINVINAQIHELVDMLYSYSSPEFVKDLFFNMLSYMYTEDTYPDWLFKTSYIDVLLYNKPLRQHAIYQRDSYQDTIDYLMEAKPYHVKLRDVRRIYPLSENVAATMTALHKMNLTIDFGNNSRYNYNILDGGVDPQVQGPALEDGTYEQNTILRNPYIYTAEKGGIDTGLVDSRILDAAFLQINKYTSNIVAGVTNAVLDKKTFVIYDNLGRGHTMSVTATDTVTAVSTNLGYQQITVTDESKFDDAQANTIRLIAIEDTNGTVEFMHYNTKTGTVLNVNDRALFNGIAIDAQIGDSIYILSSPETILFLVDTPDKQLL